MPRHTGGLRQLLASALLLGVSVAACDQPDPIDQVAGPAFAPAPPPGVTQSCSGTSIAGNKTVQVAVKRSPGGQAASGVVVSLVSKTAGPKCYAETLADGIVRFIHVAQGAQIFVVAREEVKTYVAGLEILPPALPADLSVFDDAPADPANRQVPRMLSGTACTTASDWNWANWTARFGSPCVVPGAGFNLTLTLGGNAPSTTVTLLDPAGNPIPNAVVSALSPWDYTNPDAAAQGEACAYMPWFLYAECSDPTKSSGPALIQSVDLSDTNGSVTLGHATASPLVLEAITERSGLTFFATITGGGPVQMAPGMCTIATVEDLMDSGTPALDIRYTQHSVGMSWPNAVPTPINTSLVVRAEIHATAAGGSGRFDISWQLPGISAPRSARADFVIPSGFGEQCTSFAWSGVGLSGGVQGTGYCVLAADQSRVEDPLRRAYILYFVVTGVGDPASATPITDAWYQLGVVGDGIDPSKSATTRAAISFNWNNPATDFDDATLNRQSCPVRDNNDGRFGTFRLGNNDGRFGTF